MEMLAAILDVIQGIITLDSVVASDYEGMELVQVAFYRGAAEDIPFIGEIPKGLQQELKPVNGAHLLPGTEELQNLLIFTFRTTTDNAHGPARQRITYRWYGFPFTLTFPAIVGN